MAISVVGVELSKSVFQLSIAETRHLETATQLDEADAEQPPQPHAAHHPRRLRQLRRV